MIMNALDSAIWHSYFLLKKNAGRISKYKEHIDKVKYDKINFPVNDIKFNIFGVHNKQSIYSLYISNKICDKTCNLLLIENHYVWIKDFKN